jgi:16S rRNA processing protein RimM
LIDKDQLVIIGKITKPVGLKGEMKVLVITDFPERFKGLKSVYILNQEENELLTDKFTGNLKFMIGKTTGSDSMLRITFNKYDSLEKVLFLKNCLICIPEKDRYKLPKNVYYFYDMIGCEIYNKDELIGSVSKIENYGSAELLSVKTKEGNIVLIPFIKEFVKTVDLASKRINVELIEGFL